MTVVGWDARDRHRSWWIVKNSWGVKGGLGGFGLVAFGEVRRAPPS
jgi:C1A family cysteine protease